MNSYIYNHLFNKHAKYFSEGQELRVKIHLRPSDKKQLYEVYKVLQAISGDLYIVEDGRGREMVCHRSYGTVTSKQPKGELLSALWEAKVMAFPSELKYLFSKNEETEGE